MKKKKLLYGMVLPLFAVLTVTLISAVILDVKRDRRTGIFARTRIKIFITGLGEEYLRKSNLLLLNIDKLNEEYKLNFGEISYFH